MIIANRTPTASVTTDPLEDGSEITFLDSVADPDTAEVETVALDPRIVTEITAILVADDSVSCGGSRSRSVLQDEH